MAKGKYEYWQTAEGLSKLAEWAPKLTDVELYKAMEITKSTFYAWLDKYSDISDAITRARTGAEAQAINKDVEAALLKKSLGYTVPLRKAFKVKEVRYDKNGKRVSEKERIEYAVEEMHVPADTAAIRFWLTNRDGERWKNKQDIEGSITTGTIEEYLKGLEAAGGEEF
ncbi:MAG: hypothetical protein EOM54_10095 [Clostridia bacterium]|nr:hypothetical protein [Clostridia bacterium]